MQRIIPTWGDSFFLNIMARFPISEESKAFWDSFSRKEQQEVYQALQEWSEIKRDMINSNPVNTLTNDIFQFQFENLLHARDNVFKSLRTRFEQFSKQQSEEKNKEQV